VLFVPSLFNTTNFALDVPDTIMPHFKPVDGLPSPNKQESTAECYTPTPYKLPPAPYNATDEPCMLLSKDH